MRIVLDTNCLIPAIPANSEQKWLYNAFVEERFEWAVSTEILDEYAEKIGEFFNGSVAEYVLTSLDDAPNALFAEPFFRWNLIQSDPEDNKFADLAISVGADYLITNDHHFNVLKTNEFPRVVVVTLDEFRAILNP
ncbi:MAG: putative toxin-antitoxin system toxin component, PIN family [Cytophagaceae bacterium]|nr:putative toxin-antitoxin system toxin component, PIN family [Cytophagaceae bacterium]